MLEMRTMLVNLCSRFNFSYHGERKIGAQSLLSVEDGLKVSVEARVPVAA